jgi:hypothetical protein
MEDSVEYIVGQAQSALVSEDPEYPAAILYIPDPGERHGILTRWVRRQKSEEQMRKTGFRL